ncbi:hypothetical protein KAU55_02760 [Candidatus Bathyarchaeota archaeon]|nr:hypothetical protein [Candidatus Bathyarchaeota archaeon]
MKDETKVVSTRITLRLAKLIDKICKNAHLNPAGFIRDAIRHKLPKDSSIRVVV